MMPLKQSEKIMKEGDDRLLHLLLIMSQKQPLADVLNHPHLNHHLHSPYHHHQHPLQVTLVYKSSYLAVQSSL